MTRDYNRRRTFCNSKFLTVLDLAEAPFLFRLRASLRTLFATSPLSIRATNRLRFFTPIPVMARISFFAFPTVLVLKRCAGVMGFLGLFLLLNENPFSRFLAS